MILKSISLYHFRNFSERQFKINPHLTAIFGKNARGKTNILEGIYFLVRGEGFRETREEELIIFDKKDAHVEGILSDEKNKDSNTFRISLMKDDFGLDKFYFLGKTKKARQSYLKDILPIVLFSPEQIEIINGTPSIRRDYFDKFLSAIDSEYKKRLINYSQALRKRNKVLEKTFNIADLKQELKFWNDYLISQGNYLADKRSQYVKYLNQNKKIDSKEFFIEYESNDISAKRFEEYFEREIRIRKTLIGPQKDEFKIYLIDSSPVKGKNVHFYGSRSEQRLALFWLKINELKYLENFFKRKPILLLDDIFSELDRDNQKLIFNLIGGYQTVVTSTEKELTKLIDLSYHAAYDTIDL
jgi:DNA replication and repair protein RecF